MKQLTIMAALLMTFATQAVAGETVMTCNDGGTYKLTTSLFSKPKVHHRVQAAWVEWCNEKSETLTVYEDGARCDTVDGVTYEEDLFNDGTKETVVSVKQTHILDFLLERKTWSEESGIIKCSQ